ncbi:hypothetical protein R5R35_001800 [Gryllus longicercus]|uniref:RING-type domain-containing protein n=1 Tax=Gryllus longicercus TaxID=2509291 RepID=A0AAN9W0F0_9ORTH
MGFAGWRVLVLVLAAWVCTAGARAAAAAAAAGDWRYGGGASGGGGGTAAAATAAAPSGLPDGAGPYETQALLNVTFLDRRGVWRWEAAGEPGLFARGRVGGAAGLLVPLLATGPGGGAACSPNVTAARGVPPGEPWIALVQRGGCNYDVKVENAWLLNASAVVIYNNDDSPALQKMPLEKRNISGIFITKKRGEYLVGLVATSTYVYLNISVGPTQARSYNINRSEVLAFRPHLALCDAAVPTFHCVHLTSVLFVSISFIVLMMISLAWLVFYYVQRFRYIHAKDRLSRRLCSAARKALSKIPTKVIKTEDKEMQGDYECCAVCIEPYKVSDVLRILPCRHEFHKSCIDPWLLEHRTCPMCKMDILKHYGFVFTGSQESILHVEIEEVVGLSPTASPEPETSQQNNLSPQRSHTPHTRSHTSDQQPPNGSSVDQQNQRSRSSSLEDLRPTPSSGLGTVQIVHSSSRHEGCTSNVTLESTPLPLVCSSCGSDIVAKCDAVCNTSPFPKEESTNNGVEHAASQDCDTSNNREVGNNVLTSDSCDSNCQTTSTKHANCDNLPDN